MQGFNNQCILEGFSIILELDYFHINGIYIHQIKGTAIGHKSAVVASNLVAACEKMFELLPQLYPQNFVVF